MSVWFQSVVLFVRDIATARRFYEELLGQRVVMGLGVNLDFGGFALWQADHATRMIFGEEARNSARLGRDNVEVYFESAEIEALLAKLEAADVEVVHGPTEQPWGQNTLRVRDPDGHIVEVGEPMPLVARRFAEQGLTCEQIASRTAMPIEAVRAMVDQG